MNPRSAGHSDIFDPYQGPEREFRQVRGLIAEATDTWLERLL